MIPSPVANLKPDIPQSLQLSLPNNPRTTTDFSPSSSWLQDGWEDPKWRSTNASSRVSGHKTTLAWDQKPSPKWRGRAQKHLMLPHADKWPPYWGFPIKKGRKSFNLWPSGCSMQRTRRWGAHLQGQPRGAEICSHRRWQTYRWASASRYEQTSEIRSYASERCRY